MNYPKGIKWPPMTKLSIALLGLFLLAPLPLLAAGPPASETHVFEFDYDHQIEAPVLNPPANAAAAPPEAEETPAPLPLKPADSRDTFNKSQ